jgi:hypothetical protein
MTVDDLRRGTPTGSGRYKRDPVRSSMRSLLLALAVASLLGCASRGEPSELSDTQRAALADTVRRTLTEAYQFGSGEPMERFRIVYPDSGRVVSAASGMFTLSRDSVASALAAFWEGAGKRHGKAAMGLGRYGDRRIVP